MRYARAFFLSLVVLATAFGAVPQRAWAGVDDYPSSLRGAALDALVDPWNFYNRECTSFAAWRLNNRNGMSFHNYYGGQHWGNANHWDDAARASGIPVNNGPAVGAIAQTDAGNWGHVAWVESVNAGGTVTIEDYNHLGTGVYSERTVAASAYVYIHVHDIGGNSFPDGSFVQVSGSPAIYRMAGGAPLYVSDWAAVGGPQPYTIVSQQQFDSLRAYPGDGTFIATSGDGRVYEIAGGAPLYVSNWATVGGAKPTVGVDRWDVDNISDPHAHLRAYPGDGTFIATSGDGRVYEIAGGAPLYVSNWATVGGAKPTVGVDRWDVDNISDPHAHLRAYPGDGTFIATSGDGRVYEIAGGAPLYVSNWATVGGAKPTVGVDRWDVDNISDPHAHLRTYPGDGTFIATSGDGRVYEIAGGAPLYVSNWATVGGAKPTVGVDRWDVDNTSDPHAHLRAYPADATFINTSAGYISRFAGGAPFRASTWSVFGGAQQSVTVDQWDVTNASDPHAHVRSVPVDGTVVEGLPSHVYWRFTAGHRTTTGATGYAVAVDDVGIVAYPVQRPAPTPTPTCMVPSIIRLPLNRATLSLSAARCATGRVRRAYSARVKAGLVISQTASVGTILAVGSRVGVTISRGPEPKCTVPSLVGTTIPKAQRVLRLAHCGLGNVRRTYSRKAKGVIVSQSRRRGALCRTGARIDVVVSRGRR